MTKEYTELSSGKVRIWKPERGAGLAFALVAVVLGFAWTGSGCGKRGPSAEERMANRRATSALGSGTVGSRLVFLIGGGQQIALRYIPAGTFMMGSPVTEKGRDLDETQHEVELTEPYWMGETEITQGQWQAVMGGNSPGMSHDDPNLPVQGVSWNDAQEFLKELNLRSTLNDDWMWALPTEAQWERACRAGTTGVFAGDLEDMAWHGGNSGNKVHPVGGRKANAWGLYDMHGNVWDWCADWFGDYPSHSVTNPTGPATGSARVARGGAWCTVGMSCRSANRSKFAPGERGIIIGFRVAVVSNRISVSSECGGAKT